MSQFTSWNYDYDVAHRFAADGIQMGIVLRLPKLHPTTSDQWRWVDSPGRLSDEQERLLEGSREDAEVVDARRRKDIVERLQREPRDPILQHALSWLDSDGTRPLSPRPVYTTVSHISHLWRVREAIARSKGHTIPGAEQLLERLRSLHPLNKLEQRSLVSDHQSGNIFFEKRAGTYMGLVIMRGEKSTLQLLRAS